MRTDLPAFPETQGEHDDRRERRNAVLLFLATLLSVFLVYGYSWTAGDPLQDPETALQSAQFAVTLMGILLAHEMGHYLVALRHGFRLSLPYFLPFPAAFGTFGAIIRLRSLPRSRTALLEMGAAGPLAGFAVALLAMAIGLPGTIERAAPQIVFDPALLAAAAPPPGAVESLLNQIFSVPPLSWLLPVTPPGTIPMLIMANPLGMDLLGHLLMGAPPGRYAELSPIGMAGWVGCLLTGINLLPIGQLDGGHILNALAPRAAVWVSRIGVVLAIAAGLLWSGWLVWGLMLLMLRAWISLPVPEHPGLTPRARLIGALALVAFALSFMPRPLVVEDFPLRDILWVNAQGESIAPPAEILNLGAEAAGGGGGAPPQALDQEGR